MFFWSIDPMCSTRIFNGPAAQIFLTMDLPFHFTAKVLIAYLWNSALKSMSKPASLTMKKLRILITIFLVVTFTIGPFDEDNLLKFRIGL